MKKLNAKILRYFSIFLSMILIMACQNTKQVVEEIVVKDFGIEKVLLNGNVVSISQDNLYGAKTENDQMIEVFFTKPIEVDENKFVITESITNSESKSESIVLKWLIPSDDKKKMTIKFTPTAGKDYTVSIVKGIKSSDGKNLELEGSIKFRSYVTPPENTDMIIQEENPVVESEEKKIGGKGVPTFVSKVPVANRGTLVFGTDYTNTTRSLAYFSNTNNPVSVQSAKFVLTVNGGKEIINSTYQRVDPNNENVISKAEHIFTAKIDINKMIKDDLESFKKLRSSGATLKVTGYSTDNVVVNEVEKTIELDKGFNQVFTLTNDEVLNRMPDDNTWYFKQIEIDVDQEYYLNALNRQVGYIDSNIPESRSGEVFGRLSDKRSKVITDLGKWTFEKVKNGNGGDFKVNNTFLGRHPNLYPGIKGFSYNQLRNLEQPLYYVKLSRDTGNSAYLANNGVLKGDINNRVPVYVLHAGFGKLVFFTGHCSNNLVGPGAAAIESCTRGNMGDNSGYAYVAYTDNGFNAIEASRFGVIEPMFFSLVQSITWQYEHIATIPQGDIPYTNTHVGVAFDQIISNCAKGSTIQRTIGIDRTETTTTTVSDEQSFSLTGTKSTTTSETHEADISVSASIGASAFGASASVGIEAGYTYTNSQDVNYSSTTGETNTQSNEKSFETSVTISRVQSIEVESGGAVRYVQYFQEARDVTVPLIKIFRLKASKSDGTKLTGDQIAHQLLATNQYKGAIRAIGDDYVEATIKSKIVVDKIYQTKSETQDAIDCGE